MELKVWVEGIQRIVCGVTESTTCQDVVYALAHATGKTGRFTLIERWRNNERLLAPQEHPLKVVTKWGEYSSEVQLILQRSGGWGTPQATPSASPQQQIGSSSHYSPTTNQAKRSLNFSPTKRLQVKHQTPLPDTSQQNNKKDRGEYAMLNTLKYVSPDKKYANIIKGYNGGKDETVVYNAQYRDLVRLVNYQREKLSAQQAELTKFDAEIVYWEGKTREQQHQIEYVSQEAARFEAVANSNEQLLKALGCVEEEKELVQQQERTLKSELTLLRSKLANCETELLQCKKKIRELSEELEAEERGEVALLAEVERLQRDIEQTKTRAELTTHSAESLRSQVMSLETAITDKKRQVERLVSEMKEANLQSLAAAPPEEFKMLLEGPHKPGSVRRMIGSPRQLENAVPTSKNPHGVWV
ncbi:ras association domain-containing protein 8 isoform X2 [Cimex lectularius]|uniref:Ras-associating domain-containing protein n=1 Tax=Cimex lectularius TaxID=79782 RepID=A0A8I6RR53_CIMLE|nr:ras association domain-containing protein 8 isoform X2 [Cimex lectularius]